MERKRHRHEGVVLKKGPWIAEEDEILLEFVRRYGPRDWSSIRSKGLLPRSGKSCRLRWVNKLKPNLKTGCKFTTEEQQIVIELQKRFGNKWARIATYLEGRTDNDVKNFWSTRKKRLARIQKNASQKKSRRSTTINGNSPVFGETPPVLEDENHGLLPNREHESSHGECSKVSINNDQSEENTSLMSQQNLNLQDNLYYCNDMISNETRIEQQDDHQIDRKPSCLPETQLPQFNFPDLPESILDLPILPEGHGMDLGFGDMSFQDPFAETTGLEFSRHLLGIPLMGLDGGGCHGIGDNGTHDLIPSTRISSLMTSRWTCSTILCFHHHHHHHHHQVLVIDSVVM